MKVLEYDLKKIQDQKNAEYHKMDNMLRWKEYASLVYKIHKPKVSTKKELERKIVYEWLKEKQLTEQRRHKEEFTELMNDLYVGAKKHKLPQNNLSRIDGSHTISYDNLHQDSRNNRSAIRENSKHEFLVSKDQLRQNSDLLMQSSVTP